MWDSQELERLQKQLSEKYIEISKAYVRMSKAKDLLSRNIIQSGIDCHIKAANTLSDKAEAVKKQVFDQWEKSKNSPNSR